jgi:LysR family hydrogen peroxide-inducible transcriptional activator
LVSAHLLRLMVEPFRVQHPDVDVVLREMNMSDLQRMLEDGLLDFVFGVGHEKKGPWMTAALYHEPLLFIPSGSTVPKATMGRMVQLKDIANETFVMVPDACGLARATRALFRSHRRTLHEYSGEAMSYQVLQEWATLGIGAAIVPQSKLVNRRQTAFAIADKQGKEATIRFDAQWPDTVPQAPHLQAFVNHLRKVVPALVTGLHPAPTIE